MTQEDKELLLKDLCSRLPYGVICNDNRHGSGRVTNIDITPDDIEQKNGKVVVYYFDFDECGELKNCKPYLRPLSSMTEEEEKEFKKIVYDSMNIDNISASAYVADWLYSKHLDVHGLIPKGIAIEAPEGMYKKGE